MIFFVWLLLTLPTDRVICDIWTRELTRAALVQACGTDDLSAYRVDVYEAGIRICEGPGADVLFIADVCTLHKKMDAYRLRIVKPGDQTLLPCSVLTPTNTQPAPDQVRAQCPDVTTYEIRNGGTKTVTPAPPPVCKPPQVTQPDSIATSKDLHLLAGKILWYGYARANCPGGLSGVDPETFAATACGMDGARAEMIAWQNQLDAAILEAAAEWNVPAGTLKTLIEAETQFWAWTGTDGEHGLIQITDAGAGVVMHMYQPGYYRLTPQRQFETRAVWLRSLDCEICTPKQTLQKAAEDMSRYAQALAAYYCMYGNWNAALRAWNVAHDPS